MTRRARLGAAILAVWLVVLGWHARREYVQPELTRLARATMTLAPGTHFYSVTMGDQAVGLASSRLDTVPGGFLLEDQLNLELRAMGQPGGAVARTSVLLSPTLGMREFSFSLATEAGDFSAGGVLEGDSLVRVRIEGGGGVEEARLPVSGAPLSAAVLPIRLARGEELAPGRSFRFEVFDPATVSLRVVEMEVLEQGVRVVPDSAIRDPGTGRWSASEGGTVTAWRVRETYAGVGVESWIDEDGRVLSASSLMGFALERMPYELALQARDESRAVVARGGAVTDVIFSTAIASNRDLGSVADRDMLRFSLSGVSLDGFDLEGGRQELRGDTLVVRREAWDDLSPGYSLPHTGPEFRSTLDPEPLVQSADPRIVEEARRILGPDGVGGTDPRVAAERLNHAVHGMLRKEVSFSIPSATGVLESLRGDCNEHTVLYVALARSVGLPARAAAGLVYLDGRFFYHAWPEVWLGEWVAVDPTFGETPAGAAHLRFVTGGLERQVEIARLVGRLHIHVLDDT